MSLFSVLNVGTRGLSASQLGMDVTGQNIANADVEGYSRKRLNASADYRWDGSYGQIGMGVNVVNISRMRDSFIDQQIRYQQQDLGSFTQIDHSLESIENILTEPNDSGLLTFVDNFFDSWQNLANNPADVASRTMVKTNGQILVDSFHNLSTQLRDYRKSRNDEIANKVSRVNELTAKIHNLNQEVATVEIGKQKANDSRDQRDKLLKELANIIEINTTENSLGQITITTAGNMLVSPSEVRKLETTTTTYTRSDGTTYNDIGIRFVNNSYAFIPTGGELHGIILARDTLIPEFETWLDTLANGIMNKINEQHTKGYSLQGYSGLDFFDPTSTGASDIALSPTILSDVRNIAASGGGADKDAGVNIFTNNLLNFGNPAIPLSKAGGTFTVVPSSADHAYNIRSKSVIVTINGTALQEGKDYHIDYVNGTIQMLHNGYDGNPVTVQFSYRTDNFAGPGDNSNAIAIAKLRSTLTMSPDALGNGTATFDQFYSTGIGKVGLYKNESAANVQTREFLVKQYEASQDSIAGVSLDEEMTEMIKFQHTYQAAARLITTANEMLDTLIKL